MRISHKIVKTVSLALALPLLVGLVITLALPSTASAASSACKTVYFSGSASHPSKLKIGCQDGDVVTVKRSNGKDFKPGHTYRFNQLKVTGANSGKHDINAVKFTSGHTARIWYGYIVQNVCSSRASRDLDKAVWTSTWKSCSDFPW